MSRYKDYRGPKRRGYDENYTPDYQGQKGPEAQSIEILD